MLHDTTVYEAHHQDCDHDAIVVGDREASGERGDDIYCETCGLVFCAYDTGSWQNPDDCPRPADERSGGFAWCHDHARLARTLAAL